ncbi:MAG: cytochrome C oxidase subunit IV family protein [Myxococcota bacterium]
MLVNKSHVHVLPLKLYIGIFLALIALTALTILAAEINFGSWTLWIAMLIANTKAALVLGVFMHLWFDSRFYWLILGVVSAMLTVFLVITLMDFQWLTAIDWRNSIDLPRDEKVYRYELQNPKAPPLGPGLQPMQPAAKAPAH